MKNRLSYFCSRVLFIGVGLSYLLDLNGNNLLISMILGLIIGYFILDKTKYNKHNELIFLLLISLGSSISNLCHTLYLENTSLLFIIIFTMFISFMISFIKRNAFIRLSENLFNWSIILFVFMCISLIPFIKIDYLKPFGINNYLNIIKGSLLFAGTSILPSYVLNEKNKKEYLIGTISTCILTFLILSILGTLEASLYRYPEYVVLKRIKFLNFVSNFENIFFFIILVDLIITISLCYSKLIKHNIIFDISLLILSIIIIYLLTYYQKILNIIYNSFPIFIIVTLLMTLIPKKRKYNKYSLKYDSNR